MDDVIIFQTLMNVRTQASTVVVRTPSALIAQEATFVHAHQDLNRQTQPMEKILNVQVSWLRYNLRHRFIASIISLNLTGLCYNLPGDLFFYWWSTESVKITLIQNMCRNAKNFYNSDSILVHSFIFKNVAMRRAHAIMSWVLGNCLAMSSLSMAHLVYKASMCCSNSRISHEL